MQLKKYQLSAVKSLFEAIDKPVRDIILKSPTGSGKTIRSEERRVGKECL